MFDNYFKNRMRQTEDFNRPVSKAEEESPSSSPLVTYRGIIYPWHVDHMDHMNVQHYTGVFDQSSWGVAGLPRPGYAIFSSEQAWRGCARTDHRV